MGVELAAVEAMLDEIHPSLPLAREKNSYTLGRMGAHNTVIAVMPEIGNNQAANVAIQLLNDFKSIRFGLLVGIGGGIPVEDENDIRLGDVVVSKPTTTFGGVVQFDRGKVHTDGRFKRTGALNKPPPVLSANVQKLQAQHMRVGNQISKYLSEMLERYPAMKDEQYFYQGGGHDLLFKATYDHQGGNSCRRCDRSKVIDREPREKPSPRIHYGTIGSANLVVKDAVTREKLREDLGIICVEMEAAGLMDEFQCLVIRGICDYADSHKNKRWQPYAAATAAAYAKELLSIIPAREIYTTKERPMAHRLVEMTSDFGCIECNSEDGRRRPNVPHEHEKGLNAEHPSTLGGCGRLGFVVEKSVVEAYRQNPDEFASDWESTVQWCLAKDNSNRWQDVVAKVVTFFRWHRVEALLLTHGASFEGSGHHGLWEQSCSPQLPLLERAKYRTLNILVYWGSDSLPDLVLCYMAIHSMWSIGELLGADRLY